MTGRVRSIRSYRRQFLNTGWELCSTPPGAFEHPAALAAANPGWISISSAMGAAEALRSLGHWSLTDPPRRFDALDWWFRVRFAAPPCADGEKLVLGFDGIASVADVWLDGEHLLASDNMFLAHERAIPSAAGKRELIIRCRSLDTLLAQKRPRPRWRAPMIENQQLRWFRTTILGRTPGWSPSAATVGPWRDVWLECRRNVEIGAVQLRSRVEGHRGLLEVSVDLTSLGPTIESCSLTLQRGTHQYGSALTANDGGRFNGCIGVDSPNLWWPHTHGEPALYAATLIVHCAGETITADLGPIGFRSISVRTDNGDFSVAVNGVAVFCRGACWTPIDIVRLRADESVYRTAFDQVVEAGMNMLRVSGTMVYEDDAFLDECDRRGVLLWQDFMFANMDYPAGDAAFDSSVRQEVIQQLQRLQSRACLAILCGNSEGAQQAAMWGASRDLWQPDLFHKTLPQLSAEFCTDTTYWPSSAFGGSFPHQPDSGSCSYYGIGAYLRPLEDARRSGVRFASECLAFANVPEPGTIATMPGGHGLRVHHPAWKASTPRDLGAGWDFEDVRDHYLRSVLGVDPVTLRYSDHDRYLELSRVITGEVMTGTFAELRRAGSTCRGALVWFLRDLMPGAGWGLIDARGLPKASYYYLRRALQPRCIMFTDEGCNGLFIHVVNDSAQELDARIELALFRDGATPVGSGSSRVRVGAHLSTTIVVATLFDGFRDLSYAYRFGPPQADIVTARLVEQEQIVSEAFHFPAGPPNVRAHDIGLSASAIAVDETNYELMLSTRNFAQGIRIEAAGYIADDQYFHLAPGHDRKVRLRAQNDGCVLRGHVSALNATDEARIQVTPSTIGAHRGLCR